MTTSYSDIKPDSPWRWVPLIAFTLLVAPIEFALRVDLGWRERLALFASAFALLALAIVAWFRLGSGTPVDVAEAKARETGGVRVVTRPGLAPAMVGVGIAMVAACFVAWAFRWFRHDEDSAILQVVGSMSFVVAGLWLVRFGRERPWDLRVVGRDHAAR